MSKKRLNVLLCIAFSVLMLTAMTGNAFAAVSTDITNHWAKSQIIDWQEKGLIKGYSDGTFKPDNNISRAEFVTLVNGALGYKDVSPITFNDVAADAWYRDAIAIAKTAGYINGYKDGTIRPDNKISREEAAKIIMSVKNLSADITAADKFQDAGSIATWSKGAIGAVVNAKIMGGYPDNNFKADKFITRAEAVVALNNAVNNLIFDKAGTFGAATGVQTVEGNVTVNAADVTLQNMVVKGDLLLGKGIGEGNITLKNVTVRGTTTILGGGQNSIIIIDSTLGNVTIDKENGKIRIVVSGTTQIGTINANSGVKLQEENLTGAGFGTVVIDADDSDEIVLIGNFGTVTVRTPGIKVEVPSGTTVNVLQLDAKASVTGQGTIQTADVNVSGVTFDVAPKTVDIASGVTAPVVGTTTSSSGSSSGGGNKNQTAPTGLAGVAPTTLGGSDGKITGTTTAMEYKLATAEDSTYAACSDTATTVATAGNYVVRLAAKTGFNAGATAAVNVPAYVADTIPLTSIGAIVGTAQVGVDLAPGLVLPLEATYSFQWKICDTVDGTYTDIAGATTNIYTPVAGDVGKFIKVSATGAVSHSGINYTGTVTSVATAAVASAAAVPEMTGTVVITGDAKFGATLTANPTLTNAGTPTYQWNRDGVAIPAATALTYTLVEADITKTITVTVTADGIVGTGSITSAATGVIAKADGPAAQAAPTGLAGLAPTTLGGSDGKIIGTTIAMEYKLASAEDSAYAACSATETIGLAAGTYHVRYAAKEGYNAGTVAEVVIGTDNFETGSGNNSYQTATLIATDGTLQSHAIYPEGDEDWVKFSAEAGNIYQIGTSNLIDDPNSQREDGMDTYIELYNTDGTSLIVYNDDYDDSNGYYSNISWHCSTTGTYYVRVMHYSHSSDNVWSPDNGTGKYDISITEAAAATLDSIEIDTNISWDYYTIGDTLELFVVGNYSDGSSAYETITAANIEGFNSSTAVAEQELTITVGGKTITYPVAIAARLAVTPTTIDNGTINPSIVVSLTGDTYAAAAADVTYWFMLYDGTGLTNPVVTLEGDAGVATSARITFTGTAAAGIIDIAPYDSALTSGVGVTSVMVVIP